MRRGGAGDLFSEASQTGCLRRSAQGWVHSGSENRYPVPPRHQACFKTKTTKPEQAYIRKNRAISAVLESG